MFAVVLISSLFVSIYGQGPDWSYHGKTGPLYWPKLFPEDCSYNRQSPININYLATHDDAFLGPLTFLGYDQALHNSKIKNNGHTIEIFPNSKETYIIGDGGLVNRYRLHSLNFHWGSKDNWGSEHTIEESLFPLEVQLVHINEKYASMDVALNYQDGLAVLAIFFKLSNISNPAITAVVNASNYIRYADTEESFDLGIPIDTFLPSLSDRLSFYRYNGSMTTPNCTEAVIWTIFVNPQEITETQLENFRHILETPEGVLEQRMVDNFRPRQLINGRPIFRSKNFNEKLTKW